MKTVMIGEVSAMLDNPENFIGGVTVMDGDKPVLFIQTAAERERFINRIADLLDTEDKTSMLELVRAIQAEPEPVNARAKGSKSQLNPTNGKGK